MPRVAPCADCTNRAGCAFTAFSTFICSSLDDGSRYLRRDPSIDCDTDDHKAMEGYAAFMILVWPLGVPLLCAPTADIERGPGAASSVPD